jgi:hypothetical protein
MSRCGFGNANKKLALDHRECRTHDVTEKHYDLEQSLPTKFAMLARWQELIDGRTGQPDHEIGD